jgi:hypothetical protein
MTKKIFDSAEKGGVCGIKFVFRELSALDKSLISEIVEVSEVYS